MSGVRDYVERAELHGARTVWCRGRGLLPVGFGPAPGLKPLPSSDSASALSLLP